MLDYMQKHYGIDADWWAHILPILNNNVSLVPLGMIMLLLNYNVLLIKITKPSALLCIK